MFNKATSTVMAVFVSLWAMPALFAQDAPAARPLITLRVTVDHLRLRAQPDKNAKVIAELPEHAQLTYLHETGGAFENVTLRGVTHRARWYKVSPVHEATKTGWVYGGAVALSSVFLPDEVAPGSVNTDFLTINPLSKAEYEKGARSAVTGLLRDSTEHQINDTTFVLTFDNGTRQVIQDTIDRRFDDENSIYYQYLGQFPDIQQYVIEHFGYEWNTFHFFDRRNARCVTSLTYPMGRPALSPDQHWVALAYADPYETQGGFQFLWADKTGIYPAFNLQQADRMGQGYWTPAGEYVFSWETIISPNADEKQEDILYFRLKMVER